MGGVPGDGVWLWIELNSNGTGDYTGGDCIHTGPTGLNGAAHERGDVTWTDSGGKLTISGVGLVGGQYPVTVVVPNRYGRAWAYGGIPGLSDLISAHRPTATNSSSSVSLVTAHNKIYIIDEAQRAAPLSSFAKAGTSLYRANEVDYSKEARHAP